MLNNSGIISVANDEFLYIKDKEFPKVLFHPSMGLKENLGALFDGENKVYPAKMLYYPSENKNLLIEIAQKLVDFQHSFGDDACCNVLGISNIDNLHDFCCGCCNIQESVKTIYDKDLFTIELFSDLVVVNFILNDEMISYKATFDEDKTNVHFCISSFFNRPEKYIQDYLMRMKDYVSDNDIITISYDNTALIFPHDEEEHYFVLDGKVVKDMKIDEFLSERIIANNYRYPFDVMGRYTTDHDVSKFMSLQEDYFKRCYTCC